LVYEEAGMDQQQLRKDRLANAAKSRSVAHARQAERTAEIAGKQAQLKREAQQRREQKLNIGEERNRRGPGPPEEPSSSRP
jgi:hypothetical protein